MAVKKQKKADLVLATNEQITEWKREIGSMEKMLDGKELDSGVHGRRDLIQDPDTIKREIDKRKRLIANHSPQKLSGNAANTAFKRAKELKEEIISKMPSQKDYFQPYPNGKTPTHRGFDFERTVKMQMEFQKPEMQQKVREYKNLMGRLDPDNPSVRNIEMLRRRGR